MSVVPVISIKRDELIGSMDNQYLRSLFAENNIFNHDVLRHPDRLVVGMPSQYTLVADNSRLLSASQKTMM